MQTSKFTYDVPGITFDRKNFWNFDNGSVRNVIIFGVDNSSSPHNIDNPKNNFLELGEGPTEGINDGVVTAEKMFSISFSKANIKFCLSLH